LTWSKTYNSLVGLSLVIDKAIVKSKLGRHYPERLSVIVMTSMNVSLPNVMRSMDWKLANRFQREIR